MNTKDLNALTTSEFLELLSIAPTWANYPALRQAAAKYALKRAAKTGKTVTVNRDYILANYSKIQKYL